MLYPMHVSKVESNWLKQIAFKQNTAVTNKEWKAALPHMHVRFDFMSIARRRTLQTKQAHRI